MEIDFGPGPGQDNSDKNQDRERSKREDSYIVEFGCNIPFRFNTSDRGWITMETGKKYDQNLNEI